MKTSVLLRVVLVGALMVSVLPQSRIGVAQTPDPAPTYEEALARLDQLVVAAEDLRAQIDRTQFDLEALSLKLGFDAANVVAFVRDEIAFEQYPGLLRGERGTLIGRAGNALDLAVLLTTLLTYAGYETRIARGELTPDQAQALVEQMAAPRAPEPPVGDLEAIRAILTETGRLGGLSDEEISRQVDAALDPPEITSTETYQAARADTDFILTKLHEAGVELGDADATAHLVEEARDYFWVEYRLGPADPWERVHSAFKDTSAIPDDLVATAFWADPQAIPIELQHRFRFQVLIEQWVKGELIEHPVMAPWEAPVADLVGAPVTFHNHLDGMSDASDAFNLDATIERTELFIPLVNDAFPADLRVFDLTGTPTEFDEIAPNEFSATFDLGNLIGTGPDGVDPFGSPGPGGDTLPTLTAQWIDYTLIAPDGSETTRRRTIIDRIGAANRMANQIGIADGSDDRAVKIALMQHHTFAVAGGVLSLAFVLDAALERYIALKPFVKITLQRMYLPSSAAGGTLADRGPGSAWAGYLVAFAAFDQGASLMHDTVLYRHAPSLIVYRFGPSGDAAEGRGVVVRRSIDVVHNARRGFRLAAGHPTHAADRLVWTGVWETHSEAIAIADGLGGESFNTRVAISRAIAADIPVDVVTSETQLRAIVGLSPESVTNVLADLANGYVVIIPSGMPPGEEMTGWWRVDPRSGETLGMTSDGRGAEGVEWTMTARFIVGVHQGITLGVWCYMGALGLGEDEVGALKAAAACAWDGFTLAIDKIGLALLATLFGFILDVTPG